MQINITSMASKDFMGGEEEGPPVDNLVAVKVDLARKRVVHNNSTHFRR